MKRSVKIILYGALIVAILCVVVYTNNHRAKPAHTSGNGYFSPDGIDSAREQQMRDSLNSSDDTAGSAVAETVR